MTTVLLVLIVLILLFGAAVVKGWLMNAMGAVLAIGLIITITVLFGKGAFWWIFFGGVIVLFIGFIWVRFFDPDEAAHKTRIKHAKVQYAERERRAYEEEQRLSNLSPLDSLMLVFKEYDTRVFDKTKAKAEEFYAKGDEDGLRQLVESICKRNMERLEFNGRYYSSQKH